MRLPRLVSQRAKAQECPMDSKSKPITALKPLHLLQLPGEHRLCRSSSQERARLSDPVLGFLSLLESDTGVSVFTGAKLVKFGELLLGAALQHDRLIPQTLFDASPLRLGSFGEFS